MSEPKKRRIQHGVAAPCLDVGDLLTAVRLVTSERLPVHALPHVVTAINTFLDCIDLWTLRDAVKLGSERLVNRVMAKVDADSNLTYEDKVKLYRYALGRAAAMGNLPIAQQIHGHTPDAMGNNVAIYAAMSGDLPLLKWLSLEMPEMFNTTLYPVEHVALDIAAARGDFETVQWLVATFPDSAWSLAPAALGGNLELVKWLHEHADIDEMQRNRSGELMVELMLAVGHRHSFGGLLDDKKKVLDDLKRGTRGEQIRSATAAMDAAASKGHLHVLQWLSANRQEGSSSVTVERAVTEGHVHVLAWLSEHFTELFTPAAMNQAAKAGQLQVVQWLHKNRREGCTTDAMDWAAAAGDQATVKWLHENRSEGCTTAAMNSAARNGHLEMVQWLSENRTEGCTTAAMNDAARNGFLPVVQWLHENRTEGCTTGAVNGAAECGHLDMVRYLYANRTEGGTFMARVLALERDQLAVLNWFDEHNIDLPVVR